MLADPAPWASHRPRSRPPVLVLLFLAALLLLGIGIWEPSGVTGKDEYYLGLRTPLCMMEQDVWVVPCLDGEPRLRKPPLVYWLTRASLEAWGPSLAGSRLVAVLFGALLVLGVTLVAEELSGDAGLGLRAGLVALSCLGLAIGGRLLELDVPVAAFSTLALLALLRWYRRDQTGYLLLGAVLLAAGFLTKGPVVLVVWGAGGAALLAWDPAARSFLARRWRAALGGVLLTLALALPWFLYVGGLYPEASSQSLSQELTARRFLQFSPVPLYGILMLSLPWALLVPALPWLTRTLPGPQRRLAGQLLLWLVLTLAPFLLFRVFERYLMGSLVPLAILIALAAPTLAGHGWRWLVRLSTGLCLLAGLILIGLAYWFGQAPIAALLGLAAWLGLAWAGWRADPRFLAPVAALAWACWLGVDYPRLGINAVPEALLEQAQHQEVVLFQGPQPGLLPALLGRPLVHLDERWRLPERLQRPDARFLLISTAEEAEAALAGLSRLGFAVGEPQRHGILSARVKWHQMFRPGLTQERLWQALTQRDLEPIKPQILVFPVERRPWATP